MNVHLKIICDFASATLRRSTVDDRKTFEFIEHEMCYWPAGREELIILYQLL